MSLTAKHSKKKSTKTRCNHRILGGYTRNCSGPTIICICSIHGNEPSGTIAFRNVYNRLAKLKPNFKGAFYGLAGNIQALAKNQRYIKADLNRLWTKFHINDLKDIPASRLLFEEKELKEIYTTLKDLFHKSKGPIYILDLHSTSSETPPFISINDTIRNRDFALNFNLPIILGIEEFLDGTILNYMNEKGFIALGFEGGQHNDSDTVKTHESAIWSALYHAGCMNKKNKKIDYPVLSSTSIHAGKVFEVKHRHPVKPSDHFKMLPGYSNFKAVRKNEKLATDKNGDISCPITGRIFMPLYQKQGNDGFFLVRPIHSAWLTISRILRISNFHFLLYMLPGISSLNDQKHTIVVNKKIARFKATDFFHLLGFRRKTHVGDLIVFEKREFDTKEPI